MITTKTTSKDWIEKISSSEKADKILVEKVVRALLLLEGLAGSDLDFVFKGGTALMLLFDSKRRLSIDIDIIVPDRSADLDGIVQSICDTKGFTGYKEVERKVATKIYKKHFKLFFQSEIENKESHILLDVLFEEIHYHDIIEVPINSVFIEHDGEPMYVKVPDTNNILGDKLTAFAPNTTGIPYMKGEKEMGMEIIKQMYDIGCLCEYADNPEVVGSVFRSFAETEIYYRDNKFTPSDVIDDIIDNALEICLRGGHGKANYDILSKGIIQIKSFIHSESFHLEKAVTYAAKTAYIASLIKFDKSEINRYEQKLILEIKEWTITEPMNTKLNKIKKSNPEAFFYLYKIYELMKSAEKQ